MIKKDICACGHSKKNHICVSDENIEVIGSCGYINVDPIGAGADICDCEKYVPLKRYIRVVKPKVAQVPYTRKSETKR